MTTLKFEDDDKLADALDAGIVTWRDPWRHGYTETRVFHYEGKDWQTRIQVHHDEGSDTGPTIEAEEVELIKREVAQWEPKKA